MLGSIVVDVNENLDNDGFIEFHKPVLLSITRSSAGCSESINNCNKSEGFNDEKALRSVLKKKEESVFNRMSSYLEAQRFYENGGFVGESCYLSLFIRF
ncbi:hypothetical protein OJ967_27870 (plasmid) [Peribacillus frigoritolerans]|uniref:hypothetical protein n=1 Tax=Peribacillus frigoritolerans TaxID=450367 RepID=UPI0022262724|nr:hypothetical protein [Peribacillus frigoritolerans]UYZ01851.1 hypothetical protein OJ967_27870 [Peribacillus frigoritolerans]